MPYFYPNRYYKGKHLSEKWFSRRSERIDKLCKKGYIKVFEVELRGSDELHYEVFNPEQGIEYVLIINKAQAANLVRKLTRILSGNNIVFVPKKRITSKMTNEEIREALVNLWKEE